VELDDEGRLRSFTALLESSPDSVAIVALDGKVRFLNEAGRRLIGLPDDVDVTSTVFSDHLTSESLTALELEGPASGDRSDRRPWTGKTTLRSWADGRPIPVVTTSFLLSDDSSGRPFARAVIQSDFRETRVADAAVADAQRALREGLERNHALLQHMPDVLVVVDGGGGLLYSSPSASRLVGVDRAAPVGSSVLDRVHPEDRKCAAKALAEVAGRPGTGTRVLLRLLGPGGEWVPYEARLDNLLEEPSVGGIVIVARDVVEQQQRERATKAGSRVLELIAGGASLDDVLAAVARWVERALPGVRCAVLLLDADGPEPVLRDVASPSLPAAFRHAVDRLPVTSTSSPCAVALSGAEPVLVADLLADQQWAPMHETARTIGVRSCWSFPVTSPATGAMLGTFALYGDEPGLPDERTTAIVSRASHMLGIAFDRERLVGTLEHQARHDGLTGLPNRFRLLETLAAGLTRSGDGEPPPLVVFLDLDRLKVINDSLGHEHGDVLLADVARRLRAAVDPTDLVARFGGDEFVVVSTVARTAEGVRAYAQAILDVVSEPVVLAGRRISMAASAGVVLATSEQTPTEVIRDADIAMYRAKHRGGGRFALFGKDMRQRAFDRLDMEQQIRHGIEHDEFRVHYQPIVDMTRDGRVLGFEALVRWQHPERGLLGPGAFLDLAEETGLIVPLGQWVLEAAVDAAGRWSQTAQTDGLMMSVNLAAQQVRAHDLPSLVRSCTEAMPGWTLGLEITESTLMDDTSHVADVLDQIAATGAELSIDDFGTGFSSLSYLTRLPVCRLKVDGSFVADLSRKPAATTVVAAVVGLADKLGLTVVAEGVETDDQRSRLLDMDCRLAQGYLFSRPVPEAEALAMLDPRQP
jgi:diguanylate cyclase (GGDEF)-like protein/PAS domain S-box-containing protein